MQLPANNWRPRSYQEGVWNYLKNGGKHAELIWHRRAGKDEICLHHGACSMAERPGTYWHMLPQANQVRKAIWEAVNPHTGIRRIKEAFPEELFHHRETDMLIKARFNDSTWQCLGSDNYDSAVGSPPCGITYSEWALANPSVRGYLRPIIAENNGWQLFISTPRGKNHAYNTYRAALQDKTAYAEKLTVYDTRVLTADRLITEFNEYINTYGEDQGLALFEQEYECSFDAALMGAIYGAEFSKIDKEGRIRHVPHTEGYPVHVVMDIGYDDDTAIWWFQVIGGVVRVLKSYSCTSKDPDHVCSVLMGRKVTINIINRAIEVEMGDANQWANDYQYGSIWLPHDGAAKTFAAGGRSVEEQFGKVFGTGKINIVPRLSLADGIKVTRQILRTTLFDESTSEAIESLRQYQRKWDDTRKMFSDRPDHDWTSHYADGFRYLSIVAQQGKLPTEIVPIRYKTDRTFNELVKLQGRRKRA